MTHERQHEPTSTPSNTPFAADPLAAADADLAQVDSDAQAIRPSVVTPLQTAPTTNKLETLPLACPVNSYATLQPTATQNYSATGGLVPGYDILGKVGEGGMGVVYKARQIKLDRFVALKMILSGGHAREGELARFRTEAEAIARLQHPNIVQIYEVGEQEGKPFLCLEFCAGGSLERKLNGTPLPPREAAQVVETLASAMQAAHERSVIHRDLKPANVLLNAEGTLKITDFGLAKKLDNVGQTASGAVMGTPSYMSPEQASGKSRAVGPGTDVYALGAILYECLTGRPPFKGETTLDTLVQVIECDPVPVRLLNPKVERDLETICLRCLEKEPQRRYPSAAALAADLARFRCGESISIRSINVLDRLTRALERSNLGVEFSAWGTMLFLWAAAVLLIHLILFVWASSSPWRQLFAWLSYGGQFLLMGLAYWFCRPRQEGQGSPAEQRLWSVWSGYLLACLVLLTHSLLLPGFQEPPLYCGTYPASALLTGLAFFVLGGSHWGWFYAFGLAFFTLSVVMAIRLDWAPLEFGLLWTVALLIVGFRLRRLGTQGPADQSQTPSPRL